MNQYSQLSNFNICPNCYRCPSCGQPYQYYPYYQYVPQYLGNYTAYTGLGQNQNINQSQNQQ